MIRKSMCAGVMIGLLVCSLAGAQQQGGAKSTAAATYPTGPIRIVAPFPPGGGLDIIARIIAQWLSEAWGQQVSVDNRPGAGGTIGTAIAAKAAPDGYTFLIVSSAHTINASLYRQLPYDTLNDFAPVSLITAVPHLLVVHPSLPATTVKGLIAIAKSKPGQIAYASGGIGASTHLAGELFKSMAGVDLLFAAHQDRQAARFGPDRGKAFPFRSGCSNDCGSRSAGLRGCDLARRAGAGTDSGRRRGQAQQRDRAHAERRKHPGPPRPGRAGTHRHYPGTTGRPPPRRGSQMGTGNLHCGNSRRVASPSLRTH